MAYIRFITHLITAIQLHKLTRPACLGNKFRGAFWPFFMKIAPANKAIQHILASSPTAKMITFDNFYPPL